MTRRSRAEMEGAEVPPGELQALAARLGVGRATHHLFLCADPTKPKCAPREVSQALWLHGKSRLRELGLDGRVHLEGRLPCVLRSKVDCLRVCRGGPIVVVYPDGIWYGGVTREVLDRIITEHLIQGRPVTSHQIVAAPLGADRLPPTA